MKDSNEQPPAPKKRGPKPKVRAPKEQVTQLTVRVSRATKTALELVAADLGVGSINEALAYCLNRTLIAYDIDGKSALKIADTIEGMEDAMFSPETFDAHDGIERTREEAAQVIGKFFRDTGVFRARWTPERLRTKEQRYILAVMDSPGPGYWTFGEMFAEMARDGFLKGTDPVEVGRDWRRWCKALISSRQEKEKQAARSGRRGKK